MRRGRFRRDLFYRLNVFPITMPALRDRREDLPALVRHLCDRLGRQLEKPIERIAPGTLEALERHDWPGNIRELENVIQRALVVAREGTLDLAGFIGEPLDIEEVPRQGGRLRPLVDVEGDYIRQVLQGAGWRIEGAAGAAQILGPAAEHAARPDEQAGHPASCESRSRGRVLGTVERFTVRRRRRFRFAVVVTSPDLALSPVVLPAIPPDIHEPEHPVVQEVDAVHADAPGSGRSSGSGR